MRWAGLHTKRRFSSVSSAVSKTVLTIRGRRHGRPGYDLWHGGLTLVGIKMGAPEKWTLDRNHDVKGVQRAIWELASEAQLRDVADAFPAPRS